MAELIVLLAGNTAAASVLLNVGVAKLVSPVPLGRALLEVFPANARTLDRLAVTGALGRLVGAVEVAAAGLLRRSVKPCGCFGMASEQRLGTSNIVIGLALCLLAPFNAVAAAGEGYEHSIIMLASLGALLLCLWSHRRAVRQSWNLMRSAGQRSRGGVR